jgi:hypothetical protein
MGVFIGKTDALVEVSSCRFRPLHPTTLAFTPGIEQPIVNFLNGMLLPLNYFLEFGFFVAAGVPWWRKRREITKPVSRTELARRNPRKPGVTQRRHYGARSQPLRAALRNFAQANDLVMAISGSGNLPSVLTQAAPVHAIEQGRIEDGHFVVMQMISSYSWMSIGAMP